MAAEAYAAFQRGDVATARARYLALIAMEPQNVNSLINLAILEHQARKPAQAEALLRGALMVQLDLPLAWLLRGIIAYEANDLTAAHAHFAQAVLHAPDNAEAHHYLGVTMGRKRWLTAAESELRRAVELVPDFAEAHYNLALFYLERVPPSVEPARRHYRLALQNGAKPDPNIEQQLKTLTNE
jgi:Flp pilus assembly protein TadD